MKALAGLVGRWGVPPQRPTMKDVADHVGVSRQLVSLVLRDLPGASTSTRRRVRDAAQELGYYPDASARVLRGSRSRQLGAMFTMREPFEVDLVEELMMQAAQRGYALVLGPLTEARRQSRVIPELLGQRIEGLLVLAGDDGGSHIEGLPDRIPVVQLGGPRSSGPLDDVRVDDEIGIRLLMEHLAAFGHRDFVYVTGGDGPNAASRRDSCLQQAERLGVAVEVLEAAFTETAGARAADEILARPALPTAILGANDRCAAGLLATLVRAGVRVPEDVSVVGFDDSSVARLPFTRLTTVRHDPARLAAQALDALLARIEDPDRPIVAHRDAPELVVRRSSGPARAD
jgi:DNA-binding LacI/PurR family transcriptional regulator